MKKNAFTAAPPFEEQVKALFDQFPWKKAEKVLQVLSKTQKGNYALAVYYNIDQLKKTASGLFHSLHKEPFDVCSLSTGHILVRRTDGYYSMQLDLNLTAFTENSDFFMDGKYRDEFRTAYLKKKSKPHWREPLKEFVNRTTRNTIR